MRSPRRSALANEGSESYSWDEGKYFLEKCWDRRFKRVRHTGTGFICYDAAKNRGHWQPLCDFTAVKTKSARL